MVIPLTTPKINMLIEKIIKLWPTINPAIAINIKMKPKTNWRFNGMISINQALRKIEIKIPALRKVNVLLILAIGRLKYSAIFPITIPVTITNAPVRA